MCADGGHQFSFSKYMGILAYVYVYGAQGSWKGEPDPLELWSACEH